MKADFKNKWALINDLLKDHTAGHSEFQIKNFIVGSEAHPWHRYKQCLREIAGRKESIELGEQEIRYMEEDIGRLKKWDKFNPFFRKKRSRMLAILLAKRKAGLKSITNNVRELERFVQAAVAIRKSSGFEKLSIEKKRYLEAEAWREKAKFMLCMDLFCTGRPTKQTIEFIYKLPREAKRELLMEVDPSNQKKIIEYLIE
jgi:hypothetical protein